MCSKVVYSDCMERETLNTSDQIVFNSTDSDGHRGKTGVITRVVTEPNAQYDIDVLPMCEIRLEDGTKTAAWMDELSLRH